jgi:hypothetical protein
MCKGFGKNKKKEPARKDAQSKQSSYKIELDKYSDEKSIKRYLGDACFDSNANVDVELIGVKMDTLSSVLTNPAWLITFKNHPEFQYATIEYTKDGILLNFFVLSLGFSKYRVIKTMINDSNVFSKNDFTTLKHWGEILRKAFDMSRLDYTSKTYSTNLKNGQDFVVEFGAFLTGVRDRSFFDINDRGEQYAYI